MLVRLLTCLILLSQQACFAGFPSTKINFKNISIDKKNRQSLENKWFEFLKSYPEVLIPSGKKYKYDQSCKFKFKLNQDSKIDINSIELIRPKQKNKAINFAYNLKAIEFLKTLEIKLTPNKLGKTHEIELIYLAF